MKIIIPARGGSKRILNKNLMDLNGKPLISYVIQTCLEITNDVYVSTDCLKIEKIAKYYGARVIQRPSELATDLSSTNSVIEHFLNIIKEVDYFACVQPTSPMLTSDYLKKGFNKVMESGYNSIISVTENNNFFWNNKREPVNFQRDKKPRTQDMQKWYAENGAFYITSKKDFLKTRNITNGDIGFIVMPKKSSFEIDTYEDFEIVEKLCKVEDGF